MLKITNAQGRIKKLNARLEFEGDESRHAADVAIEFQIVDGGKEALTELGYPELALMYDDNNRPKTTGLDFKIREKVHHIEAAIFPKGAKSKKVDLECDVGGLVVTPIQGIGLNFKCKLQGRLSTEKFGKLWDLWCDGDVLVTLTGKQLGLQTE